MRHKQERPVHTCAQRGKGGGGVLYIVGHSWDQG